jgi:hypothetical protein
MLHLVTAHKDEPHITAENQGALNIEIFGNYDFVFDVGRSLEASAISNNLVRIYDGRGMMEGRFFELDQGDYEDVTIENGTQGQKRIDLIVVRYSKDSQSLIETISFEVIKGTPSATPVQPSYNDGSILNGDSPVDFPLYAVHINGLTIESVEQLFSIYDGVEGAMNEITPEMIDEWWGSTILDGDSLTY